MQYLCSNNSSRIWYTFCFNTPEHRANDNLPSLHRGGDTTYYFYKDNFRRRRMMNKRSVLGFGVALLFGLFLFAFSAKGAAAQASPTVVQATASPVITGTVGATSTVVVTGTVAATSTVVVTGTAQATTTSVVTGTVVGGTSTPAPAATGTVAGGTAVATSTVVPVSTSVPVATSTSEAIPTVETFPTAEATPIDIGMPRTGDSGDNTGLFVLLAVGIALAGMGIAANVMRRRGYER
jgi:hypothetical protein